MRLSTLLITMTATAGCDPPAMPPPAMPDIAAVADLAWLPRADAAAFGGALDAPTPAAAALAEGLAEVLAGGSIHPELAALRAQNPEWDLLARMFTVMGLADLALADPASADDRLVAIDAIIGGAVAHEAAHGFRGFLLPYGRAGAFLGPDRSLFVDGEIGLMLGARRLVRDDPSARASMRARVAQIRAMLAAAPAGLGESYPDEGWSFCHAAALVALRMSERLDGEDHSALIAATIAAMRAKLTDTDTGLLASSFTRAGVVRDGPEGSSIWFVAHALGPIAPELAADQYRRARAALIGSVGPYAFAREWPDGARGRVDVDSGAVLPWLGASPSSSGFAVMAARGFGDRATYQGLIDSLALIAEPRREGGAMRFAASNLVGDAVLLAGLSAGPLWRVLR